MAARSASSDRSRAASRLKGLRGCETPRIWARPLRELTPETSLGFAAIEFAETVCELELFPWQKWLLIHALELADELTVSTLHTRGKLDPIFRYRRVVVLVARQNGKSTLSQVLSLFFLYELGTDLILGTAQDLDTAEEVWQGALDIIEETPELSERALKPILVNGKKTIRLNTGERYKVKAANRKAGRGLSGDLVLLDELREHQTWDAWGAITKTTNARPAAIIWSMSNAGDSTSIVLRHLRKKAHGELGDPDGICAADDPNKLLPSDEQIEAIVDLADEDLDDDEFEFDDDSALGLFEWSAKPDLPVDDIDGLLQANPSIGHCVSIRTLLSDAKNDPEWVTRTEVLCQWSEGTLKGPFPPGSWDAGKWVKLAEHDRPGPEWQIVGKVKACIDISHDRTMTYISFAGRRMDGLPQGEVVAQRAGDSWVKGWLLDARRKGRIEAVTGQKHGAPVSQLLKDLAADPEFDIPIEDWAGDDLPGWTGRVFDLVKVGAIDDEGHDVGVRHFPQPALDLAAATAVAKPLGDRFVWDRKQSPTDIAALVAFTGALGLLTRVDEGSSRSIYEDRDLVVI